MFLNPNAMAAQAAAQQPQTMDTNPQSESQGPVKLFVGQVPGVCTEEMLQPLFAGFGKVLEVSIMRDKTTNRSKGSAWVVYEERSSAETAIKLLHDQHIIPPQTNPLQIKFANSPPQLQNKQQGQNNPFWQQQQAIMKQLNHLNKFGGHSHPSRGGRKLFVGQVPRTCSQEQLTQIMAQYGTVDEICVLKDKTTGQGKGCAFVVYSNRSEAEAAIKGLNGVYVIPPMTNPMQVSHADGELEEKEPKLFVGMVPYKSSEDDIRAVFGHYGEIAEVALLRGPNGQSRGCAFVKYVSMESAQAAVQNLHGNFKMEGGTSALTVKLADSEKEKKKRQKLKQTLSQLTMLGAQVQGGQGGMAPQQPHQGQLPQGGGLMPGLPLMGPMGMLPPMIPGMMAGIMPTAAMGGMPGAPMAVAANTSQQPPAMAKPLQPLQPPPADRKASGPPGANIFIMNLPLQWTDADLSQVFAAYGQIISATVFRDRITSQSKGFGFVSFSDPAAAQQSITAMNGYRPAGHSEPLKVQLKNNDKAAQRGGGMSASPTPGLAPQPSLSSKPSAIPL
eukprot:TRINITY_DN2841_c0_g2_i1.p1 TRINITY_DN2841_c0_g2~~TRINITY_DN2841_c0_g2_i1.p1  ORF type:complete len:599 (+),score=218.77 TRINITY_DN2841_c0_g2_i1:126-1799(+)